jgi:hypothetical protein
MHDHCAMPRRRPPSNGGTRIGAFRRIACVLAAGVSLTACSTASIGQAPNLRGTYLEHAFVTNPNGGGPQVVVWGPADNSMVLPAN